MQFDIGKKKEHTDKCKRLTSAEETPHICGQSVFDKGQLLIEAITG